MPELAPFLIAVCFAAGLNVSGTVALLGLLGRAGALVLPGDLGVLMSWWVIGPAAGLFVVEVIADKIPLFDLIWNVLQTFIRVPAAAILAYVATPTLDPAWQLAAGALGALIALIAHTGKTALRAAASTSPEPASNIGLSFVEDLFALGVVWFASEYPWLAAGVVVLAVVIGVILVRWLFRRTQGVIAALRQSGIRVSRRPS